MDKGRTTMVLQNARELCNNGKHGTATHDVTINNTIMIGGSDTRAIVTMAIEANFFSSYSATSSYVFVHANERESENILINIMI